MISKAERATTMAYVEPRKMSSSPISICIVASRRAPRQGIDIHIPDR
jgi:hypothetical protein